MLIRTARLEWRHITADRTFPLAALLLVVLMGYALYNGLAWVRTQDDAIATIAAAETQRFADIDRLLARLQSGDEPPPPAFLDARLPATMGDAEGGAVRHAVLPPAPLAALAIGQSDLLPYYLMVTIRSNDQLFLENGELDNPHNLLAGRFDLAFVIVGLLPILILALTYNVLSGEKEQGTLALALAQPVRLGTWLGAKLAMRAACVLALTLGCLFIALLAAGVDLSAADTWLRAFGWLWVVVLYAGFWLALAVWVNALGRSSATNATILAAIWLALVVVVPSLVDIAAVSLHPAPSRVELIGATRAAEAEASALGADVLEDYSDGHGEVVRRDVQSDTANTAAITYAAQQRVTRQLQPLMTRFNDRLAAQQRLVARYRFLSPAMLAQDALIELAGTGPGRHRHFRESVQRFIGEWKAYFAPRIFRQDRFGPGATASLPAYRFAEERTRDVLRRTAPALAALGVLAFGAVVAGVGQLRKYPIAESR